MKIWIAKNSEVPVREQLMTQITLAVAAGDLAIGEKLPSTREIARRCGVHANTVSSAYQKLVDQNVLEFKQGSGYYVAELASERIERVRSLDELMENFFESAKALGFDEAAIIRRLKRPRSVSRFDSIAVIDPDAGLRDIIVHELSESFPAAQVLGLEKLLDVRSGCLFTAMLDEKPKIDPMLNDGQKCVYLKGRSVSASMSGASRPSANDLIAVASGWDGFLAFARIMLLAADIEPGRLVIRSTRDEEWKNSIRSASMIICDTLTANDLSDLGNVRTFRVVSDESLAELADIFRAP